MSGFRVVVAAVDIPSARLDVEEAVLAEVDAQLIDLRGRPLDAIAGSFAPPTRC